jgi:peroxiredoxin
MRIRVLTFLFPFLLAAAHAAWAADIGIEPGKAAPAIELEDLSGKTVALSEFGGRVVLLNFWSTLCAPCREEMPSLNRLHAALEGRGFLVLSVSIDSSDKLVREFVSAHKIAFPVLLDREKEVFFDEFAGPSLPASYLIDKNGVIRETFSGPREWDSPEMKAKVLKLLSTRQKEEDGK